MLLYIWFNNKYGASSTVHTLETFAESMLYLQLHEINTVWSTGSRPWLLIYFLETPDIILFKNLFSKSVIVSVCVTHTKGKITISIREMIEAENFGFMSLQVYPSKKSLVIL